jgi:hypothetical protein
MSASTRGAPPFVQQLQRAAAQRGRLDPLYQDLSEQLTRILQRLYPVWTLIGPGLSDPAHIELHSRWIYLDADELLGPRAELAAGRLQRRAILRTLGAALHETLHAKHTKRWALEHELALAASGDPADRQLALDRRLLEEPRMEATGCRDFAAGSLRARFAARALEAAVTDVILPRFAAELAVGELAGSPASRELAGRATVYLRARTLYGIIDRAALAPLEPIWQRSLGSADMAALGDLYARVLWIHDGDLDGLDVAARRYREIIGPSDEPPDGSDGDGDATDSDGGEGGHGEADDGQAAESSGPRTTGDVADAPASLAEALEQAIAGARGDQLAQLDEEVDLQQLLDRVARDGAPAGRPRDGGGGTGAPQGRLPDRGVDRPPFADEVQSARRYATRLQRAITIGTREIDKRTPGGCFDGRAHARGQAQRAAGQPITTRPWRVTRVVRAPIHAPHVLLVVDTSGSMAAYEYALGPIAWILSTGLRAIDGRLAIALFGDAVALLSDGRDPLRLVPGLRTGGGTAFAGDALCLAADALDMTDPRRVRLAYCLSDGGWYDTRAGVEKIRRLAAHGVPTIHLAIGAEPLSVEADRIVVLDDPADALDRIAADTVAALQAASRAPRRG